jgi:hypothetical protein
MHTRDDLVLRSCLDLAVQMLAIRRDLDALRMQVEGIRMQHSTPRAKRAIGYLLRLGKFFETKLGQAILAIGGPAIAGLVKWLLGSS